MPGDCTWVMCPVVLLQCIHLLMMALFFMWPLSWWNLTWSFLPGASMPLGRLQHKPAKNLNISWDKAIAIAGEQGSVLPYQGWQGHCHVTLTNPGWGGQSSPGFVLLSLGLAVWQLSALPLQRREQPDIPPTLGAFKILTWSPDNIHNLALVCPIFNEWLPQWALSWYLSNSLQLWVLTLSTPSLKMLLPITPNGGSSLTYRLLQTLCSRHPTQCSAPRPLPHTSLPKCSLPCLLR